MATPEPVAQPAGKLWLWKNFVDGRPEYWAFDNPYPVNLNDGDPQTLGEPCGYAIFKPSRHGRTDVSEERVLRAVLAAQAPVEPQKQAEPMTMLTEDEVYAILVTYDGRSRSAINAAVSTFAAKNGLTLKEQP